MSSPRKLRVFMDTSALFAAVLSESGGARLILKLASGQAIELVVSSQVLDEAEGALQRKAPEALGHLALLLDEARCRVIANPFRGQVDAWEPVIPYLPDAAIFTAAIVSGADYFVTLDRQHYLGNPRLVTSSPLTIGTPGDFIAWLRGRLDLQ